MLVLTRKVGEEVVIDGSIRVVLVSVEGDKVRLGFSAPPSVRVDRKEVFEQRLRNEPHESNAYHETIVQGAHCNPLV